MAFGPPALVQPAQAAINDVAILTLQPPRSPRRQRPAAQFQLLLLAVEREFGLGAQDLRYSAAMLHEYGNLSSAFVYFVLEAALADHAPDGWWWLSSFGAGFSCHGALLEVRS